MTRLLHMYLSMWDQSPTLGVQDLVGYGCNWDRCCGYEADRGECRAALDVSAGELRLRAGSTRPAGKPANTCQYAHAGRLVPTAGAPVDSFALKGIINIDKG